MPATVRIRERLPGCRGHSAVWAGRAGASAGVQDGAVPVIATLLLELHWQTARSGVGIAKGEWMHCLRCDEGRGGKKA